MAAGEKGRPWRRRKRRRAWVINYNSHGEEAVCNKKTSAATSSTAADWSSVPGDILCVVLMKLGLADLSSFARVCRRWRTAAMESKAAYVSSLGPLLRVERTRRGYSYDAFYSLSDRRYYRFKREEKPPPPPPRGSEHSWRIIHRDQVVCTFSCGYWVLKSASPEKRGLYDKRHFLADPLTGRVVPDVCFPPAMASDLFTNDGFLTAPPGSPDCALVVMYYQVIWWCRPGDATWSKHHLAEPLLLEEVRLSAVVGGKLYAVSMTGALLAFSFPAKGTVHRRLAVRVVGTAAPPEQIMAGIRWLVESEGRLLSVALMEKTGGASWQFLVHQLEEEEEEGRARWVAVRDLGQRALLLSMDKPASCSVPSTAAWGGAPNSIYYSMSSKVLSVYHIGDGRTERLPVPDFEDFVLPALCAFEF